MANLTLSRTLSGVPANENSTTSTKTQSRSTISLPLLTSSALSLLSTLPFPTANLSFLTTFKISLTDLTPFCSFSNDVLAKHATILTANSFHHLKLPAEKFSSSLRSLKADSMPFLRTCPRFNLINVLWVSKKNWRSLIGRRSGRMVRMHVTILLVGGLFSRIFEVIEDGIQV